MRVGMLWSELPLVSVSVRLSRFILYSQGVSFSTCPEIISHVEYIMSIILKDPARNVQLPEAKAKKSECYFDVERIFRNESNGKNASLQVFTKFYPVRVSRVTQGSVLQSKW